LEGILKQPRVFRYTYQETLIDIFTEILNAENCVRPITTTRVQEGSQNLEDQNLANKTWQTGTMTSIEEDV
jgi:hypothetical protein